MLSGTRRTALALAVNALSGLTALAAEHAGDASEAKPSLFAGDLGNAIWTLAIFFLLLFVLGKFAWNPLLRALQNREQFIRESLAAAKRDREGAEARLREYEQRIQKAHEQAAAIVEESRRDAEVVKRRLEEEARQSAEEMLERAKREIGIARDTALKDLYEQSAGLATTLAGSVLKRQLTSEDQQALVRDAMAALHQKGSEN